MFGVDGSNGGARADRTSPSDLKDYPAPVTRGKRSSRSIRPISRRTSLWRTSTSGFHAKQTSAHGRTRSRSCSLFRSGHRRVLEIRMRPSGNEWKRSPSRGGTRRHGGEAVSHTGARGTTRGGHESAARDSYEAYARAFREDLNHFWSGLAALQMGTIFLDLSGDVTVRGRSPSRTMPRRSRTAARSSRRSWLFVR